jgi:aspartate kinase
LKIIVQKFGGSSIVSKELRTRVCNIIKSTRDEGYAVVVVVSAMGRKEDAYATDTLINLVTDVNSNPSRRELDLIMACGEQISGVLLSTQLAALDIESQFLTGAQAGIVTDGNYGNAHIRYINPKKIIDCLERGMVPVVAGFQGISEEGELNTLGRGGSDTTASALGVALNAEFVDIFTDVEGIMTADPRIVQNARLLDEVTYNEICQLARDGAKVIHPRAIEIAMQKGIPLRVRSTFTESVGTLVTNHTAGLDEPVKIVSDRLITGITYTSNIAQIKIITSQVNNQRGLELKVFKSLALASISVDFINVQPEIIMFTVPLDQADKGMEVLKNLDICASVEHDCAKVAIVGAAMTGIPGIMAKVVEALTEADIQILQSGDSYTNIWCLVKKQNMNKAVQALHDKFELGNK